LGNEVGNPTIVTGLVTWASNQGASGSSPSFIGTGVLKGPAMGQPLMLAAESRFLEAEAQLKGFLAGDYVASFNAGITASFNYLLKTEAETTVAAPAGFVTTYKADNAGNRLVDITLATTDAQRLEAIITQKYIAMNMITSDEAFNEYRRTGYPVSQPGGAPAFDIASNKSTATARPDRLPTRILYPSSEQAYNSSNFLVVNPFGDLLFWDPN
jgi:hypothetical protein